MHYDPVTYNARLPRHPVVDSAGLVVEISSGSAGSPLPVELLDFSRNGMRFISEAPLNAGADILVRLRLGQPAPLEWRFAATVRWVHPVADGPVHYGCEFTETVGWEQLGELLLHGILSPE